MSRTTQLLQRIAAGDQAAAAEVFHTFVRRLIGLVRSRLDSRLQRKFDPEDVVQSAFNSFFALCRKGTVDCPSDDALWGLLALITLRKCGYQLDYFYAICRNATAEQSQALSSPPQPPAADLTPDEAAATREVLDEIIARLDEREQTIFLLSLENHSTAEISRLVGRSERTVTRVLARIRGELEAALRRE